MPTQRSRSATSAACGKAMAGASVQSAWLPRWRGGSTSVGPSRTSRTSRSPWTDRIWRHQHPAARAVDRRDAVPSDRVEQRAQNPPMPSVLGPVRDPEGGHEDRQAAGRDIERNERIRHLHADVEGQRGIVEVDGRERVGRREPARLDRCPALGQGRPRGREVIRDVRCGRGRPIAHEPGRARSQRRTSSGGSIDETRSANPVPGTWAWWSIWLWISHCVREPSAATLMVPVPRPPMGRATADPRYGRRTPSRAVTGTRNALLLISISQKSRGAGTAMSRLERRIRLTSDDRSRRLDPTCPRFHTAATMSLRPASRNRTLQCPG